jgi:hypothetical protein
MVSNFKEEAAKFYAEVEEEAARLIRDYGVAPWNALDKARETVRRRRAEAQLNRIKEKNANRV